MDLDMRGSGLAVIHEEADPMGDLNELGITDLTGLRRPPSWDRGLVYVGNV